METVSGKLRLDQYLVDRLGYESRSRARDAILRGCVFVDGNPCTKPGTSIAPSAKVTVEDAAAAYVSRAALKLKPALAQSGADVSGKVALDVGASTGGFTQVLLEAGVRRLYAVDVGTGQLHPSLAADPRVVNLENRNIRELSASDIEGERPDIIVCDLSFISLQTALASALALANDGAWGFFLIKPQFEVGRDHIGKGGIVRDETAAQQAVSRIRNWFENEMGWRVVDLSPSPLPGGDGNREFMLTAIKESP